MPQQQQQQQRQRQHSRMGAKEELSWHTTVICLAFGPPNWVSYRLVLSFNLSSTAATSNIRGKNSQVVSRLKEVPIWSFLR